MLPVATQRIMPYMVADNWLFHYANLEGISRVLHGMNRRTNNRSKMNFAIQDLRENYNDFENEFRLFFEELITIYCCEGGGSRNQHFSFRYIEFV